MTLRIGIAGWCAQEPRPEIPGPLDELSPPVPYAIAYVRLEGATSSVPNYVRNVELGDGSSLPDALRIEAPVHVVFAPEPQGRITDFWFEPGQA